MTGTVARSTPYPWPYDGRLEPSRLALVLVLPGGDAAGDGSVPGPDPVLDPVLSRIALLAGAVAAAGGALVEVSTASGPHRQRVGHPVASSRSRLGTTGLKGTAHRVVSGGIDGFYASTLDPVLREQGRDQLLVCGQWLETSVHSTMRSANDRGYECLLVLDACIPLDRTLVPAARSQIEMSGGIFGAVGETAAVLDVLIPAPLPPTTKEATS